MPFYMLNSVTVRTHILNLRISSLTINMNILSKMTNFNTGIDTFSCIGLFLLKNRGIQTRLGHILCSTVKVPLNEFCGRKLQWHMQSRDQKEPLWSERIITTVQKVCVPVKLPKYLLDLGAASNWLNLGQSTRWSWYRCFANMLEQHSCLPKMIYLRILSKIPCSKFFLFAWILNFRQKWTQISVFSSQRYLAQLHGDHFQAWPKSKGLKN